MNFETEAPEEILDRFVGGFRRYRLNPPVFLTFISQNLCDTVGYTKEELTFENADAFASLLFPADREIYEHFLNEPLSDGESRSAEYRLIRKNGSILYVKDTLTAKRLTDEALVGYAVLTDITAVKRENESLRFLDETVPCGLLRYTCEKHPKVTFLNDRMLQILRCPDLSDSEPDYTELFRENIYLMIPLEERQRFSRYLDRISVGDEPISGEISVIRCDGTRARLFGWVSKRINEDGIPEFQSICMDITERYRTRRASETERYLKALTEVYDLIFEYDFAGRSVKYVYGSPADLFGKIRNVPMHLEEATEQWVRNTVHHDDRAALLAFFHRNFRTFIRKEPVGEDEKPPQIRFRICFPFGEEKNALGIFLKIGSAASLFCCKYFADEAETELLKNENRALKNMQEFVMRFNEGVVAFRVEHGTVTPMYASDNVCRFFGYTKEEWLSMAGCHYSINNFISRSILSPEDIKALFSIGEAEFTYFDITQNANRRIKAICSQKNADENTPFYVMLYNVDPPKKADVSGSEATPHVKIRTFGYFDVFVNDKPIAFRNKKAKELFALLVDRRGGFVSSEEAIAYLWENEPVNAVTLARYRKEALRLKNTLEEYGIPHVVESVDGKRRIVPESVECDLYDYLSGKDEYAAAFKGSYLSNYSWGEVTLGELLNNNLS